MERSNLQNIRKQNFINNRKIKLAIIGIGRIAKYHVDAVKQLSKDLTIVAACDISSDNMQGLFGDMPVTYFSDYRTCLAESSADVVVLCTPSGLHAEQTILAAEYGKHVITEKPLATNWEQGVAMLSACDKYQVELFEVKQNRYNGPLQLLKQAADLKRFGKIYMVSINVFWHRGQNYYDLANWRGTKNMDGGCFMNQAAHYFDLLNWIVGPVESVFSMKATLGRDIEMEDVGNVLIKWQHGALGTMNVTVLTYPKDKEGSITIIGEHGTVKIGGVALNAIEDWQFATSHKMDEEVVTSSYSTDSVYGFGHLLYYKNIIEVFRGNAVPMTPGSDAIKSLEILEAAYRSASSQQQITLPLSVE